MLASVIIRTYNEEKYLGELLRSLDLQTERDFETIIVDSGSTDNTLKIASEFEVRICSIKKSEFTFGRSLNIGCENAEGQFLIFISAHCIPTDQFWLQNMTKAISEENVALAYGRQVGYNTSKFSELQVFKKYFPANEKDQQGGFFCNNANSVIRKELWEKYHFNEKLTGLEDMDWAKHFHDRNYLIRYQPEANVFHIHEETWKKVKIRYEREAYALKEIMPEIHFKFWDFIWSFFRGVYGDLGENFKVSKFPSKLKEIVLFRFCQFYGAYKGNHIHRKLSRERKTKYFYP